MLSYFAIKIDNRHRGISDCIAAQRVYEKLQEEALKEYATLEEFSKTFKSYAPKIRKQPPATASEIIESWKQGLYASSSVSKAFRFFEKLDLKKNQLIEFAEYLNVSVHKYSNKDSLIRQLVRLTVGEKLNNTKQPNDFEHGRCASEAQDYEEENYLVISSFTATTAQAPSGSFSHVGAIAGKMELEKKSEVVLP